MQRTERDGNRIVMTDYNPPGVTRHITRWTIEAAGLGIFEEFEIRDGQEVKVAIGKYYNGKVNRTDLQGNSLGDDFGQVTVERKPIDTRTEQQSVSQEIGGKTVTLVKIVTKLEPQAGPSSEGDEHQVAQTVQVMSVQQVVGNGEVTLTFGDDITKVDRTSCAMNFRSHARFNGDLEKVGDQASLKGRLTTADGRTFGLTATHTIGSVGLSGIIVLTTEDGALAISMDLSSDNTGVGIVKDLRLNRSILTISVGSGGTAVIRDADDRVVQKDILLFKKS